MLPSAEYFETHPKLSTIASEVRTRVSKVIESATSVDELKQSLYAFPTCVDLIYMYFWAHWPIEVKFGLLIFYSIPKGTWLNVRSNVVRNGDVLEIQTMHEREFYHLDLADQSILMRNGTTSETLDLHLALTDFCIEVQEFVQEKNNLNWRELLWSQVRVGNKFKNLKRQRFMERNNECGLYFLAHLYVCNDISEQESLLEQFDKERFVQKAWNTVHTPAYNPQEPPSDKREAFEAEFEKKRARTTTKKNQTANDSEEEDDLEEESDQDDDDDDEEFVAKKSKQLSNNTPKKKTKRDLRPIYEKVKKDCFSRKDRVLAEESYENIESETPDMRAVEIARATLDSVAAHLRIGKALSEHHFDSKLSHENMANHFRKLTSRESDAVKKCFKRSAIQEHIAVFNLVEQYPLLKFASCYSRIKGVAKKEFQRFFENDKQEWKIQ